MANSAYIKLVEGSAAQQLTMDNVKQKIQHYIDMTTKTGQQLDWSYTDAAFPYTLIEKAEMEDKWFYLKGKDQRLYKYIVIGIGEDQAVINGETVVQHYIQIVLPEGSTHGDKGKANEFCKYLAKEYKAELHLFNKRIMYYNPRK